MVYELYTKVRIRAKCNTPSERQPKISDQCLDMIFKAVERLRSSIEQNMLPAKASHHRILSRMVTDSWPLGTDLGKRISELEDLYGTLE